MIDDEYEAASIWAKKWQSNLQHIDSKDIIATPLPSQSLYALNYLCDCSVVRFDKETVTKLIDRNELEHAFAEFGVTNVLGYDTELSKKITDSSMVKIIFDDQLQPIIPEPSTGKTLFMYLLR